MAESIDPDLAPRLRAESEAGKESPYPKETAGTRVNRRRSRGPGPETGAKRFDPHGRTAH